MWKPSTHVYSLPYLMYIASGISTKILLALRLHSIVCQWFLDPSWIRLLFILWSHDNKYYYVDVCIEHKDYSYVLTVYATSDKGIDAPHRYILINHLIFCFRVVECSSVNKMQSIILATVFGPIIMCSKENSIAMLSLIPIQNKIMEVFLTNYDIMFNESEL